MIVFLHLLKLNAVLTLEQWPCISLVREGTEIGRKNSCEKLPLAKTNNS